MVIFDLEWNSGLYEKLHLDEILQIGAVKCDRPGGWVKDSFSVFIRPKLHRRYSPAAEALPDLEEAKRSPLDFKTAAGRFFDWCAGETVFATWGANDFMVLRQNIEFWKLDVALPATYVDLQSAFDAAVGSKNSISLERAVEYCRVPDIFDPHNALSDAIYAWAVCAHVTGGQIEAAQRVPAVAGLRHPTSVLPKRKTPWRGPYESEKDMLNNRACRRATCPECGARIPVTRWAYTEGGPYFAKFTCPAHGPRLWRLESGRDKLSRFWGNGVALEWTAKAKAAYQQALKGKSLECRGRRRSGR